MYSVSDAEKVVHTAHVEALMKQAGVQGVGIGSRVDSPGDAALMIVTVRGVPQDPIPAVIDGLYTLVRESSRFRAGVVPVEVRRGSKVTPAQARAKATTERRASVTTKRIMSLVSRIFLSVSRPNFARRILEFDMHRQ